MPDRYTECGDNENCDWDLDFDDLWIQYLDVGQGDGTFLYFPASGKTEPQTVLIDLGSKKNAEVAGSCARQFIYCALKQIQEDNGWNQPYLDKLFVTHGDGDHYNLILPLLDMFDADDEPLVINQLIIGGRANDYGTDFRQVLIQTLSKEKKLVVLADSAYDAVGKPSWTFMDGKARLYLLSANFPEGKRGAKNPKSIVLKLQYDPTGSDQARAIFMGDAEATVEDAVIDYYKGNPDFLRTEALKLGHHGSRAGTSDAWIDALLPDAVFASADMKWAHPYCETIERVKENTVLWNDMVSHGYLCGEGAGAGKYYEQHSGTTIGIFVNLVDLSRYVTHKKAKKGGPSAGRSTTTIDQMETVDGARFEMKVESDGSIVISQGALVPGARLTEVFRLPPRSRRAAAAPPPAGG